MSKESGKRVKKLKKTLKSVGDEASAWGSEINEELGRGAKGVEDSISREAKSLSQEAQRHQLGDRGLRALKYGLGGALGGFTGGLGAGAGAGALMGGSEGASRMMSNYPALMGGMAGLGTLVGGIGGGLYGLLSDPNPEKRAFVEGYTKRAQELAGNDYVDGPPAGLPGPQTYPPLFQTPEITTEPPHPMDVSAGEAEQQKSVQKQKASKSKYKAQLAKSQV